MNFATYVAGTLADGSQLPTNNISATYTGHLIGAVEANGRQYVQAGSYSNNWNFQSRTGQLSIGFDGRSFTGATNQAAINNVNFSASVGSGDRTLTLNGAGSGRQLLDRRAGYGRERLQGRGHLRRTEIVGGESA
jgi:hypothetical protein